MRGMQHRAKCSGSGRDGEMEGKMVVVVVVVVAAEE